MTDTEWRLAQEIADLTKENAELKKGFTQRTEMLYKLQTQINKMKCCYNCKHDKTVIGHCNKCNNFDKWELAE